jgi:hypothetical protein
MDDDPDPRRPDARRGPVPPWAEPGEQPQQPPPRPPWATQPPPAPPAWGAPSHPPQWGTPPPGPPPGRHRGLLVGGIVAAVVGLLLVVALVVVVVVVARDDGGRDLAGPAERSEAAAAAGCTFTRQFPSAGAEHVGADEPATDWNSNPPTSGQHTARSAPPGFYERELDERAVVHSLEHGYVAVQYRNLAPEQVARLRDLAAGHAGEKLIVMPWSGLTADGVAITAWQHSQTCEQVAPDVIEAFMTDFMAPGGRRSVAPEPFAQ